MRAGRGWMVSLAAFAAAGYVFLATAPYGPGITSDSIHYITAAQKLLTIGRMETYTGSPLVSYAPLLPFLYASLAWIAFPILFWARFISAVSFGMVVAIAGRWSWTATGAINWAGLTVALVLFARPLLWYSPYALSELLFVVLTLAALWSLWLFVQNNKPIFLLAAIAFSALSILTRYIGLTAVLAGTLFLLFNLRCIAKERVKYALLYLLPSCVPFVIWLWRNQQVSGTFFGIREASDYRYQEMLFDTLWSWSRWVIPAAFPKSVTLFAVFLILLIGVGVIRLMMGWRTASEPLRRMLWLIVIYIVTYSASLVFAARGAKFEGLSERLWLPVAVPVVLLVTGVAAINVQSRTTRWFKVFLAVFVAGWIMSGMLFAGRMLRECIGDGPGVFNIAAWRQSPTMRFMQNSALKGVFYSNFPEPLYYYTGVVSYQVPHKGPMRVASETLPRNLQQFLHAMQEHAQHREKVYLIWFHNPSRSHYLYTLSELGEHISLHAVKQLPDGKVLMAALKGEKQ